MKPDNKSLIREIHHSYEKGRFENALWALLFVVPLAICSIFLCQSLYHSLAFGTLLGAILVFARWMGKTPGKAVFPAVLTGLFAYVVLLASAWILPQSEKNLWLPTLVGLISGLAILILSKVKGRWNVAFFLTAGAVVITTGSLGCQMLGDSAILCYIAAVAVIVGLAALLVGLSKTLNGLRQ